MLIGDQAVVLPFGDGKFQQGLKQSVQVGCGEKVFAPGDEGDALQGVIDDDGKVVAGRGLFAGEDDIAKELRFGHELAVGEVVPTQAVADEVLGFGHIEPQGIGQAAGDAVLALGRGSAAAGAGVERAIGALRGLTGVGDLGLDVLAGAEAGIEQALGVELIQRGAVVGEVLGLFADGLLPIKAEPREVGKDGGFVLGAVAGAVDVFEPDEELTADGFAMSKARRIDMPQMEQAGGRGSKTGAHGRSLDSVVAIRKWLAQIRAMPIYEFYSPDNNKLYQFFARSQAYRDKTPRCPDNPAFKMERRMSKFAIVGKAKEESADDPFAGMDETKMESFMAEMERDIGTMDDTNPDPKQLGRFMRKMTDLMGDRTPESLQEMVRRLEAGEDPEKLEEQFGDIGGEGEEGPAADALWQTMKVKMKSFRETPQRDKKLYEFADYV